MKKLALVAALILLSGFVIVTLLRRTTTGPSDLTKGKDTLTTNAKSEIDDFWAAYNRAEELFKAGQFDQSLTHYLKALRIDSTHENTWYRVGNVYAETGRFAKALSRFERLIEINPMSSRAHRRAGQLLSRHRPGAPTNQAQAKFHFAQAQKLNRAESGPHYSMGGLLITQGETKPGRELLQKATATNPKFVEAFRLLGYTSLINGRYAQAIESYLRALRAGGIHDAPSIQSGEGDTKASLSQKGPYGDKDIAALYGLAVAARAAGGYPDAVSDNCRLELSTTDALLVQVSLTWTPEEPTPTATTWADMDSDGQLELITIGPRSPLQVWRMESNSRFSDISSGFGLTGSIYGSDLFAVDFDRDSDTDIFVLVGDRFAPRRLMLIRNDGGRLIDATASTGLSQIPELAALAFGDFERDNPPDLVVLAQSQTENSELLLYSVLGGYFQLEWSTYLTGLGWPTDIAVGDYDNDGYLDLYISRWKKPGRLMKNAGGESFVDVTKKSGLGSHPSSLAAEFLDFNHDDHLDLFVSEVAMYEDALRSVMDIPTTSIEHRPTLYVNRGDGSFESIPFDSALGHHFGTMDLSAADFNGDGYTDIFLANGGFAFDRFEPDALLLNHAGLYFTRHYTKGRPTKSLSISLGNIAGDNRPRLLTSRGGFHLGQPATAPEMFYVK